MTSEENDEECGFWASFSGPKHARSYKWVSTAFVLLFLIVGGFVAWVTMKSAANKLTGGGKYNQLSANSAAYGGGPAAKAEKEEGFFASEEELAKADPALKKELLDDSGNAAGQSASDGAALRASGQAGGAEGGNFSSGSGARSPASGSGFADRLFIKAISLGRLNGGPASKSAALGSEEADNNISLRPAQPKDGAPGGGAVKGPKTSVMEALKSAFKANLYGARLASQDAAKGWIAKAFDANPDSPYSLEYDEKMKSKLDRVNPNSIPKFLREQDINATEAKSLGVSDVGKPEMDKEDTREALKEDKDYQSKKNSAELAKKLFTPLGPFTGSGGSGDAAATDSAGTSSDSGDGNVSAYSDSSDSQDLQDIALQDYIDTNGYGEECGCTLEEPCYCSPPSYFDAQQCPLYGPFQPGDPCSTLEYDGAPAGDFPSAAAGTLP